MARTIEQLQPLGITPWIEPRAGMFVWCRLPDGIDAAVVARRMLERKIVLAPGNAFSHTKSASGFLRFNVAQCANQRIFSELARLMK